MAVETREEKEEDCKYSERKERKRTKESDGMKDLWCSAVLRWLVCIEIVS